MNPQQLVEKLAALGFVDGITINKIRREIDDPDKTPSVNQILKYLVKKGLLTDLQAKNIINQNGGGQSGAGKSGKPPKTKAVKHEVIKVSKPKEGEFDTNDLTSNVNADSASPAVPNKTQVDQGLTELDAVPVVSPAEDATRVVAVHEIQPVDYMAGPMNDPLDYQASDPYQSGGQPAQPQTLAGFAGET